MFADITAKATTAPDTPVLLSLLVTSGVFRCLLSGPGTSAAQHGQRGTAGAEQLQPQRVRPRAPAAQPPGRAHSGSASPALGAARGAPRPPSARTEAAPLSGSVLCPLCRERNPRRWGRGTPTLTAGRPQGSAVPSGAASDACRAESGGTPTGSAQRRAPPGTRRGSRGRGGAARRGRGHGSRPVPPRPSPAGAPTWSGGTRTPRAALPHPHSRPPLRRVSGLAEPGRQWAGLARGAVSDWLAAPSIRTLPLREVLGVGPVGNARLRPLGRGREGETRLRPPAAGAALRPCLWPLVASGSPVVAGGVLPACGRGFIRGCCGGAVCERYRLS